jgi:hypothetical protein
MTDHANCFQHLVTFVQDKVFHTADTEIFISDESVETPGGGDDNMRTCILVANQFEIFLERRSAVENRCSDFRHIFSEPGIFIANLKRQLTSMTQYENRDFAVDRLNLLQCRKYENCGFSEPRFGLAENIGGQNRLRETNLLYFRGMFETFPR